MKRRRMWLKGSELWIAKLVGVDRLDDGAGVLQWEVRDTQDGEVSALDTRVYLRPPDHVVQIVVPALRRRRIAPKEVPAVEGLVGENCLLIVSRKGGSASIKDARISPVGLVD